MATVKDYSSPLKFDKKNSRTAKINPGTGKLNKKYILEEIELTSSSSSEESLESFNESPSSGSSPEQVDGVGNKSKIGTSNSKNIVDWKDDEDDKLGELEEDEFNVEEILDSKIQKGKRFFYIKWLGWNEEHNTWEPEENLDNCQNLIKQFFDKKSQPKGPSKRRRLSSTSTNKSTNSSTTSKSGKEIPTLISPSSSNCDEGIHSGSGTSSPVFSNPKYIQSITVNTSNEIIDNGGEETIIAPASKSIVLLPAVNQDIKVSTKPKPCKISRPIKINKWEKIPVYHIRTWNQEIQEVNVLVLDITEDKDEFYNVIVTEDITGLIPIYVYGAAQSIDGMKYCLVQFANHPYVDIVLPNILFARFPRFREYFKSKGDL